MENLTLSKFLSLLNKNIKLILLFTVVGLAVGVLYAQTVFQPRYESTVKLLMKGETAPTLLSPVAVSSPISGIVRGSNPALTQIQIITSDKLANQVWSEISKKYEMTEKPQIGAKIMQEAITVQNPVGTEIIEITAAWKTPEIAKDIAETYKNVYVYSLLGTSKEDAVQSKMSIDRQLANAENNLGIAREKLKNYRQSAGTIDIAAEASGVVGQLVMMENRYNEVLSAATDASNRSKAIAAKIGLDWKDAVNSVAIGHNETFTELQSKLGAAKEEYAGLASKYTKSHPAMKVVSARIANIESELANQIKLSIGEQPVNSKTVASSETSQNLTTDVPGKTELPVNNVIITDPVRTGMVEELATNEATYRGLIGQSGVLRSAINNLKGRIAAIPAKQNILSNLLQDEANWTTVVNALKAKQVEASIREAEITSSLAIVDEPVAPMFPSFPGKIVVALMFGVLGALLGVISALVNYLTRNVLDNIDELETMFQAPILGIIPWLSKDTYYENESMPAVDNNSNYYSLAYQRIVTNINVKGYNTGLKTLAFTSSEFTKYRSTILMNIAHGLNKAGKSVIVVDADFRTPSVHQEFEVNSNEHHSIAQLLTAITHELSVNNSINWHILNNFIQEVPGHKNLHVITNYENVSDPYEFLHSNAFEMLISKLKETYDWILIDTPPVLAVADAVSIGSITDGILLSTGIDSVKSNLAKAYKLFKDNHIPIFGIVAREIQQDEAASTNKYIKQIISRMMPESNDLYSENR